MCKYSNLILIMLFPYLLLIEIKITLMVLLRMQNNKFKRDEKIHYSDAWFLSFNTLVTIEM